MGDNCLDIYYRQDVMTVAGNALNVAANWANTDLEPIYLGAIGSDKAGSLIIDSMNSIGLSLVGVESLPGLTGVTLVNLVKNDREFVFEEFGVCANWFPSEKQMELVSTCSWVHIAGPSVCADILSVLTQANVPISVDLSTKREHLTLKGVEIAFVSLLSEVGEKPFELAEQLLSSGAKTVVITAGSEGSWVFTDKYTSKAAAIKISPVDTCGAGDSYIASFIHSYISGLKTQDCLEIATEKASQTCLHFGSINQEPLEIPTWLKEDYYLQIP